MSELPRIVQAGDPVLRGIAEPVPDAEIGTRALKDLVETMVLVMRNAPGVGLAAPQIGIAKQIIVLEDAEESMRGLPEADRRAKGRTPLLLTAIVNPILTLEAGETATFFEGCLSVTGYMALVTRALRVEVTGMDPDGQAVHWRAQGWPARILQHEVDHLRGTLYVDRMLSRSLVANDEYPRYRGMTTEEVMAALNVVR